MSSPAPQLDDDRDRADDPLRLPTSARPTAYRLLLRLDFEGETFNGTVSIDLDVVEPISTLTLNSDGLTINEATVTADSASIGCEHRLDAERELLHVSVDEELPVGAVTLELDFSGTFDDQLVGLYLCRFEQNGRNHKIATTQFEAPYARRCFPCWDEPEFKATFEVSAVVDQGLEAVSNGAEVGRQVIAEGPDQGRVRFDFAPTVPMSTYLVALVAGPLELSEPAMVDGVTIRVVHRPGQGNLTSFAHQVAAFALPYLRSYFNLPYPGSKLDLVALPDFAFGAMENLGCVTFREASLLIDPDRSTKDELQRVADVINHEIAHMWFGDLVTMKWWNGIWLNEAFASFMEMKCTDSFRPDWDRWTDFGLSLSAAYRTDSLRSTRPIEYEVRTPDDAEAMFDVLTYEKGAGVVRMLEQYLGEEPFRRGIRLYMDRHQFANADTTDLWDAIEEATGEPVRDIMDTWIFQGGHPTITADRSPAGIELTQTRSLPLLGTEPAAEDEHNGDHDSETAEWQVPFTYRLAREEPDGADRLLVVDPVSIDIEPDQPWIGNAGSSGFFRMRYAPGDLERLADLATEDLSPIERFSLIDDAWAGVLAGHYTTPTFLNLLEALAAETNRAVWVRMISGFSRLRRLVSGEALERMEEIIHDAIAPSLAGIGLAPSADETDDRRQLRADMIRALGTEANDPEVIAEAKRTVAVGLRDPELVETSVFSAALAVSARHGDGADYDDVVKAWKAARTPQDELRFLYALPVFTDAGLADRTFGFVMEGSIRSQNAPFILQRALTNPFIGHRTWDFITGHWGELQERFATSLFTRMLQGVPDLDQPGDVEMVRSFLDDHHVSTTERTIDQIVETQRINSALRLREADRLARFLAP